MRCYWKLPTKRLLLGSAAISLLLGATTANATISYSVNQTIGGGSVVGSIQTDGSPGVLGASDITGWNLLLTGLGGAQGCSVL
jgi:hypothetical protein